MAQAPTILLFDSGLGGLTVFREVKAARPDANFIYVADDAGFPYGNLDEDRLVERVIEVVGRAISDHSPDLVVVACNTASTLALGELRTRFRVPFVGTVPAIKPACAQSASKRVAVLGAGSWRTTFAKILADGGADVMLWARRPELAREVQEAKRNSDYLPGVNLPLGLRATSRLDLALAGAEQVYVCVPS